jgi:SAM-dependent methyltransferase
VEGVEFNAYAREYIRKRYRYPVFGPDELDAREKYDVITMFDVIEHLDDPGTALMRAREFLAPGGRLFITTPNTGSLVARLLGNRWYHYDLVQHIALFNPQNLGRVLAERGFSVLSLRSIGHVYRVSYIEQRLQYLSKNSRMWKIAHIAALPLRLRPEGRLTLNAGDVLGLVAEAR